MTPVNKELRFIFNQLKIDHNAPKYSRLRNWPPFV